MAPASALLPPNFLATYTDVIPGLRRLDMQAVEREDTSAGGSGGDGGSSSASSSAGSCSCHRFTSSLKGCLNTLARPLLAPAAAVALHGVQLLLPQLLHNLLSVLPHVIGLQLP
jgi:hypothetical protein